MWSYSSQIAKNYIQTIGFGNDREGKISAKYFPNLNFQFESKSITIKPNTFSTQTLVYLKTHNICFFTLREEDTDLHFLKITPFFTEDDELVTRNELFYMVQGDTAKNQHYQIQKVHKITNENKSAKLVTFKTNVPRALLLERAPLVFNSLGNVVGILTERIGNSSTKFGCRQLTSNIDKDIIEWINKDKTESIDKDRIEYVSPPFDRSQSVLD